MSLVSTIAAAALVLRGAPAPVVAPPAVPLSVRLEWEREAGAETCLDRQALAGAVERRWGRVVFTDAAGADLVLRGRMRLGERGAWAAAFELFRRDGSSLGSRELVTLAADCSALDDAVALAAGLMVDVSRHRVEEERDRRPIVTPRPPIRIPEDTAAPRAPWRVAPALGAEAAIGLLPGVAAGLRLALSVEPPRSFRFFGAATAFRGAEGEAGRYGVHLSLWTAELGVCPASFRASALTLRGCVAERLGQVRAEGIALAETESARELIAAAGVLAEAGLELGRHFLVVLVPRLEVPFVRYRFVYRGRSGAPAALYEMPPLAASAWAGLEARW